MAKAELTRVVLADDHAVVRKGIREFREEEGDIQVVAEATTGAEAVALTVEYRPDVALLGISTHQRSMRKLVEELDARSARLAAAHLSDRLSEGVALLELMDAGQRLTSGHALEMLFDGGLARLDASGKLVEALPSLEIWRARPISELLTTAYRQTSGQGNDPDQTSLAVYSPLFVDPLSNRDSLLIGLPSDDGGVVVGAMSLDRLGLNEVVVQAGASNDGGTGSVLGDPAGRAKGEAIAFLVDAEGRVLYHPDPTLVGQDLRGHAGVMAVIQGQTGATYHREPDDRELAVGCAPVAGPGWGLIVQQPWEALIAPVLRLSLLAPLAVVVAALVSGLAVTFGLRYVVRPLQALDRQATRVAWGDFSAASNPVEGVQEIEDLRRTLEGMADQIQHYQSGMRDYITAVTMAQEEERERLARELHDETVQSLIALGHRVEMVQKSWDKDPARARQRLADLRMLAGDIQQEVRRFSRALRPLYLEDLGFVPALEMLTQEMGRENGLPVSVRVKGEIRRLAPDFELTAFRIAQEGLSNVARHAQARNAWLTVTFAPNGLILGVRDDGRGFEPPRNPADLAHAGHFGLMGIRERALLFGGRMEVRSRSGEGTTLEVFLPLPDTPAKPPPHRKQ